MNEGRCAHQAQVQNRPQGDDKLKSPPKTDKRLGPSKDTWCEFHQAFGRNLRNCLTLGQQLNELVKDDFLKEYLEENQEALTSVAPAGEVHEVLVHGEVNTISRGFSGGGCTASQRNNYAREVMAVEAQEPHQSPEPDLYFTKADLQDMVPHDNDPVVILVVKVGRRVHRFLID